MGLGIAFRAFSAALFDKQAAQQIRQVLDGQPAAASPPAISPPAISPPTSPVAAPVAEPVAVKAPARSDAITLLSALQREARLVDLVQENLAGYSDAQVGAAARPCLQQCAATLRRLVQLEPVSDAGEGAMVTVPDHGSPARYQWIGEGTAAVGKLVHHGWQAGKVELPQWTGADADANVIAPAQLQR